MTIDEHSHGPVIVLVPHGRLSVETFGELKTHIQQVTTGGCRQLVLNLKFVGYVDSIGVAELVRSHVILDNNEGRLALSDLNPTVTELLDLTRLSAVLDTYPTEIEALQSFASDPT